MRGDQMEGKSHVGLPPRQLISLADLHDRTRRETPAGEGGTGWSKTPGLGTKWAAGPTWGRPGSSFRSGW